MYMYLFSDIGAQINGLCGQAKGSSVKFGHLYENIQTILHNLVINYPNFSSIAKSSAMMTNDGLVP